jgi:hypothetical protein
LGFNINFIIYVSEISWIDGLKKFSGWLVYRIMIFPIYGPIYPPVYWIMSLCVGKDCWLLRLPTHVHLYWDYRKVPLGL